MAATVADVALAGEVVIPASAYARDRRAWLAARRSGLGASDTAAVLGLSDWATPLSVWLDKTSSEPVVDTYLSEAAEWGTALEAVVARKVATRHRHLGKIAPTPGLLRHREHPWMLATLDRILVPRRGHSTRVDGLEVKTTSREAYRSGWIDGVPPARYQVQAQQQMAVTGLERVWLAVLVGGQRMPEPYPVDRDERVIEQLIAYGGHWWWHHVEAGVRPDPTFADRDTLARLWPGDPDGVLVADDDLRETYGSYLDARRREAEAREDRDRLAFAIQTAMRDATTLQDPTGEVLATWRPVTTRRASTTRLKAEHPDVYAAVLEATTTRTFRPKEQHA